MKFTLIPKFSRLSISRECPSGALKIDGEVGFYSEKGIRIASRGFNNYGGLAVEFSLKVRSAVDQAIEAILNDLDEALRAEDEKGTEN